MKEEVIVKQWYNFWLAIKCILKSIKGIYVVQGVRARFARVRIRLRLAKSGNWCKEPGSLSSVCMTDRYLPEFSTSGGLLNRLRARNYCIQ